MSTNFDVVVIGAGAAGLLAAARTAERGRRTLLVEKNRKAGVKILMSGGTRCNLTQNTDADGIISAFGRNGRFLRSALRAFGPSDLVAMIEAEGVPTKIEATGKVFPASDKALDVQQSLLRRLHRSGCELRLDAPIRGIQRIRDGFDIETASSSISTSKLIVSTGGRSYPGCGTTGDGYAWMESLGHRIVPPRPALVPITTDASWAHELAGITCPDVLVRVVPRANIEVARSDPAGLVAASRKHRLDERRGSMLLTHFGLSGPTVLDVSREVTARSDPREVVVACDFLPDATFEQVDDDLRGACMDHGARALAAVVPAPLPQRLTEAIITRAQLDPASRAAELDKASRRRLVAALKCLVFNVIGTRGFAKAEVTAGGVSLSEVDSRTMESKLVPGLFIIGELLDLDGYIGGYNFQSAFSTAWLAAENCG